MQNVIISILALTLGACSYFPGVHKIDIQQGNVISQDQVDQLRLGMTRNQVRYVMGTPMLIDTFHQDRWDFLYSFQKGGEERIQEQLTLHFADDRLARLEGDYSPQP